MDARPFRINGITADFGGEMLRDAAGNAVMLRPQTFAVLRYLTAHANRLVTKDELMQAVWPGIAVTDDSLVQCVHEIRRALGDTEQHVLQTLPRRGYRLMLPETDAVEGERPGRPMSWGPWQVAVAGTVAAAVVAVVATWWVWREPSAAPNRPAIAVLPFETLGAEPAQAYVADGIMQDLTTELAKISGISVVAGNSTSTYGSQPADVRVLARDLGVQYVLEGAVQWQGDAVRVNAKLIDAVAGNHLWAERYDGPLEELFAFHFQDKVIAKIVSALSVELVEAGEATAQSPNLEPYGAIPQRLHSGDDLVIEAKIPRAGNWLEYGFDSIWTTVGNSLLRIDPADNSFDEIDINSSGDNRQIVAGEGAIWIPDRLRGVIIKLDPVTERVVQEIPAKMLYHQSKLGTGDGSIWVMTASGGLEQMLTRFSATTGAVQASIPLPSVGADVLFDFGAVWVAGVGGNAVYRIDPETNALTATIAVHTKPKLLCSTEGSLWVLNTTDGFVDRIDGATGQVTASINAGLVFPLDGDMACGGGYVWGHVAAYHAGDKAIPSLPVVQIDPRTNEVVRRYIGGKGFGWDLRYGAGSLWMTGSAIFRVRPPA